VFYALMLLFGLPGVALQGVTDGRSIGAFAVIGLLAIWAGVCSVLGHNTLYEEEDEDGGRWRESLVPPGGARRRLLKRRRERERGKKPALDANFYRGTQGVTGVIVGVGFVVIGVLAALGAINVR
jgi:hypothetical protein